MAFKDMLLALTTYPQPTPVSAVDDAVAIAAALGGRVSAIACEVRMQPPGNFLTNAVADIRAVVAAETRKSADAAEALLAAFQSVADRNGVLQDRIAETCQSSQAPDVMVDYARLHDLTIVPVPTGDFVDQWYAEAIIFGSGRPTMILPHERRRKAAFALGTAVVAWDSSRPAARAIADALPVLRMMKRVHVLTVTREKTIDTRRSGAELAKHLARQGVEIVLDEVDAAGRKIGAVLEAQVEACNADLLVMGAYGHSRLREFVLGGATRSMLERAPVPVLLSH